jgi:hypothetical protein
MIVLAGIVLSGCSESTRTIFVPTFEERTISGERLREQAPLVLPPDYKNPTLHPPKEDSVLKEYQKNNFIGQASNVPLPKPRPYDLTKPKPCLLEHTAGCVKK